MKSAASFECLHREWYTFTDECWLNCSASHPHRISGLFFTFSFFLVGSHVVHIGDIKEYKKDEEPVCGALKGDNKAIKLGRQDQYWRMYC